MRGAGAIAITVRVGFFSGPVVKLLASTTATLSIAWSRFHAFSMPYFAERCIRTVPP